MMRLLSRACALLATCVVTIATAVLLSPLIPTLAAAEPAKQPNILVILGGRHRPVQRRGLQPPLNRVMEAVTAPSGSGR